MSKEVEAQEDIDCVEYDAQQFNIIEVGPRTDRTVKNKKIRALREEKLYFLPNFLNRNLASGNPLRVWEAPTPPLIKHMLPTMKKK